MIFLCHTVTHGTDLRRSPLDTVFLSRKSWGQGKGKKELNLWISDCSNDVVKQEKKRMRDCKIYYFLTDMTIIHWPRPLLGLSSHIYIDILSLEKTSLQREAYSLHIG